MTNLRALEFDVATAERDCSYHRSMLRDDALYRGRARRWLLSCSDPQERDIGEMMFMNATDWLRQSLADWREARDRLSQRRLKLLVARGGHLRAPE